MRPGRPLALNVALARDGADGVDGVDGADALALALADGGLSWVPAASPAAARVSVRRVGSSSDALRHGEPVGLLVEPGPGGPGGYLLAGAPGAGVVVAPPASAGDGWAQWEVTGEVPGAGVLAGRRVGLLNLVQGDHVVRADDGPDALGWWAGTTVDGVLPVPPALRPVDAGAGEVELNGALVPVGPDGSEAGLLLLDRAPARDLGSHLLARVPDRAERLTPDGVAGSVACRWPGTLEADLLPDAGTRVWVRGVLVAAPGLTLTRVRGLAWALTVTGEPVPAAPGDPGWPGEGVVWRVVTWPPPPGAEGLSATVEWALPLPGRDGERGSSTTFTRLRETLGRGGDDRRFTGRDRGSLRAPAPVTPPTIVRDVRTGRRGLRFVGSAGSGPAPAVGGVTVRVHVRG